MWVGRRPVYLKVIFKYLTINTQYTYTNSTHVLLTNDSWRS